MSTLTTVSVRNQVSIPAELARELGIEPGCRLEWNRGTTPRTLVVTIVPDKRTLARELRGRGRELLQDPKGSVVEDLVALRLAED